MKIIINQGIKLTTICLFSYCMLWILLNFWWLYTVANRLINIPMGYETMFYVKDLFTDTYFLKGKNSQNKATKSVQFAREWMYPDRLPSTNVCFIVMASSLRFDLHYAQRRSFLREFPHVYAFADESDGIYVQTLDSLRGKRTRQDAQHRQLSGAKTLLQDDPNIAKRCSFFAFIDDDTWINTEYFLHFLGFVEKQQSLLKQDKIMVGFLYGFKDKRRRRNGFVIISICASDSKAVFG